MDYKPLPIGIDNFEMLITRGYYFIDKSMLIKELIDKKSSVNLFTRPRRFGKTLNMSMLQYFFEDAREEDGKKRETAFLFDGLDIMRMDEKYLAYMGQYPVISLSLKAGKQPDFELSYDMLIRQIAYEYERHSFILKDERLSEQRERYLEIMREKAERSSYSDSIQFLSKCLEKYYGKKVVILIDEYDVPLENAFFAGFYDEMVGFLRSLFESALKTNGSLEFAVITGCLRMEKEAPLSLGSKRPHQVSKVGFPTRLEETSSSSQCQSIFTGLNNFEIISIMSKQYDEYFGFTALEVKKLCEDYNLVNKYDLVKEWYNGYVFVVSIRMCFVMNSAKEISKL